jgi:hypothetical protein
VGTNHRRSDRRRFVREKESGFPYNLCWKTKREETHMDDTTICVEALAEMFYKNLVKVEDMMSHLEYCAAVAQLILRAALIKNIRRFDEELKGKAPKSWRLKDRRKRTIITLAGEITYFRNIYIDEAGCRRYLLDEVLGVTTYMRIAPDAFKWIVCRAADVSYEKAAKSFKERTGAHITRQTVMRCVHRCGRLLEERWEAAQGPLLSVPVVFMEFDGFYVDLQSEAKQKAQPRRTYKEQFKKKSAEMKVWCAYAGKSGAKGKKRRIATVHWASDKKPEDFFSECVARTSGVYDLSEADYLAVAADAAGWCKAHGIEAYVCKSIVVTSHLDTFHVNQKVLRAFSSEEDRSLFLGCLYKKDFDGFFRALGLRMESEPEDTRYERRRELYDYIKGNLDWLSGPSVTRLMREKLIGELACVFGGRAFYGHLVNLLAKRRYKRFLADLERTVARCADDLAYDYRCFYDDAKEAVRMIRLYGPMVGQGTMEGTNSKVYAARLKVWGCAWSERGAIAMMRIRATIASGKEIACPGATGWLTEAEQKRIEGYRRRGWGDVPESIGQGYEPPRASFIPTANIPPSIYPYARG